MTKCKGAGLHTYEGQSTCLPFFFPFLVPFSLVDPPSIQTKRRRRKAVSFISFILGLPRPPEKRKEEESQLVLTSRSGTHGTCCFSTFDEQHCSFPQTQKAINYEAQLLRVIQNLITVIINKCNNYTPCSIITQS